MTDAPKPKPILMQYQPQNERDRLDILNNIESPVDKSNDSFRGFWLSAHRVKLIDDEPVAQNVGQPPPRYKERVAVIRYAIETAEQEAAARMAAKDAIQEAAGLLVLAADRVRKVEFFDAEHEPVARSSQIGQPPPLPPRPRFWSGPGGALLVDREIAGVTQDLTRGQGYEDTMRYYSGRHFVGETIAMSSARVLASALGGDYLDEPPRDVRERFPANRSEPTATLADRLADALASCGPVEIEADGETYTVRVLSRRER